MEGGHILAGLLAIWLHRNDNLFKGRVASTDGVTHAVDGLAAACSSRTRGERGLKW